MILLLRMESFTFSTRNDWMKLPDSGSVKFGVVGILNDSSCHRERELGHY